MTEVTKLEKLTKSFFEVISLPSKKMTTVILLEKRPQAVTEG